MNRKSIIVFPAVWLTALLCASVYGSSSAQDFEKIAQQYKNEPAVITSTKEQLIIKNEHGTLVATSNIATEKMLISELSPGIYNRMHIYHSYFNQLDHHDEEALIPWKGSYKKQNSVTSKTRHYDQDAVFYDDTKETEISFSGLTPGAILRSEYTIRHTDLHMLPAYYFPEYLPSVQSVYEVVAPKYVNMHFVIKGCDQDRIRQSRQENKNTVTYTFTATDVPAYKSMDYIPSASWHELQVIPSVLSYQLPGEDSVAFLPDVAHLYSYFYSYIRDVNKQTDENITRLVGNITKSDAGNLQKAAHIYQWVQENIHYIAFEDSLEGFVPRQAASICTRKFGDCKDMASILVAMCRAAGIDAYFTWIGTRTKPYNYEETPLPIVDNHMICTIKIGEEWIFLDGTHSAIPFGVPPAGLQDKEAMISLDEHRYKIIQVPERDAALNVTTDSTIMSIADKQVNGRSAIDYQGYQSWDMRSLMRYNSGQDHADIAKYIGTRGTNKYIQQSFKYTTEDTGSKRCRLTATFKIDDYAARIDKEYIVNMNVNRYFYDRYIDTAGRNIPAYFKYRSTEREYVILQLPKGYHVAYLPADDSLFLDDGWMYTIRYRKEGSSVILIKEYVLSTMAVAPQYFAQHNTMIDRLKKQYKESVVLTADL